MKMNKEAIVAVAGFGFSFTLSTLLGYGVIVGNCTEAEGAIALVAMAWGTAIMHSWLGEICRICDKRKSG